MNKASYESNEILSSQAGDANRDSATSQSNTTNLIDEGFLELISHGDRHDLAMYRNRIIEEQRRRNRQKGFAGIKESMQETFDEQVKKRRLYAILTFTSAIIVIVCAVFFVIGLKTGNRYLALGNICVVIMGILNTTTYCLKLLYYSKSTGHMQHSVILIPVNFVGTVEPLSEKYRVLERDSDEMLDKKKARLDEMLGF